VRARTVEDDQVLETILTAIRQANSLQQEPDFYDLLGLQVGAEPKEIKKAYRSRARICHPDLAGEDGHEACVVLNEAYATLMDDDLRENYEAEAVEFDFYDEGNPFAEAMKGYPYTGQPLSRMVPLDHEENMVEKEDLILQAQQINKAVFVDEITCIGCTMCTHCAPKVFEVEEESGRARAVGQWLNDEDEIQDAIDSCPVDCIHWVPKEQLAPLEYTTQVICTERVSVGMMLSGQGVHRMDDPFDVCKQFLQFMADREEKRRIIIKEQKMKKQRREEAERMRKENEEAWKNTGKSDFWKKAANPEGNKKA
jgi:ferredoxin/vacuolar-type H+-ATPase subunit F/Vma7